MICIKDLFGFLGPQGLDKAWDEDRFFILEDEDEDL